MQNLDDLENLELTHTQKESSIRFFGMLIRIPLDSHIKE